MRGMTPTSHCDRPDLLRAAAVRAALLDRDLLADEVLVDRLGGPLDELLRQRVLDDGASPSTVAGPTGNGSSTRLDDPVEEQLRASPTSAPSSPARPRSARAGRPRTARAPGPRPPPSRCFSSSSARLERTCIWRTMSSSVESIESSGASSPASSSTIAPASRRPSALDALPDRVRRAAPRARRSARRSSHLALPTCARSSSCASQSLRISACASSSASSSVLLGDLARRRPRPSSAPSFVPTTIRSSARAPRSLLQRRVDDELAVDHADAHGADRAEERQRRDHQRRRGAVDAEDVVRRDHVGRERRCRSPAPRCGSPSATAAGSGGRSCARSGSRARSARPSRLKKPPGIFPAAYIRSSTSTVSGKKSAPSRASIRPCAVASTIVSPERTTTAPSACLASLPVSKVISWPPTVTLDRRVAARWQCSCLFLHSSSMESGGLSQPGRAAGARSNFHPPVALSS